MKIRSIIRILLIAASCFLVATLLRKENKNTNFHSLRRKLQASRALMSAAEAAANILETFFNFLPISFITYENYDDYGKILAALVDQENNSWVIPQAMDVQVPTVNTNADVLVPLNIQGIQVPALTEDQFDVETVEELLRLIDPSSFGFPSSGSVAGIWDPSKGNPEEAIKNVQLTQPNSIRILRDWGPEKFTDAGFSSFFFEGIGQHRVQEIDTNDAHANGAKYVVAIDFLEAMPVRVGFHKYGGRAYFDEQGQVMHIRYLGNNYKPSTQDKKEFNTNTLSKSECNACGVPGASWSFIYRKCVISQFNCINAGGTWDYGIVGVVGTGCIIPEQIGWKIVKTLFISSFNVVVTIIDHLIGTHFTAGNTIARSSYENLNPDHPLRRLFAIFGFRTAAINYKAFMVKAGEETGIFMRATSLSFSGMQQLFEYANSEATSFIKYRNINEQYADQKVDPSLGLPLHVDGNDFFTVMKEFVSAYLHHYYSSVEDIHDFTPWYNKMKLTSPNAGIPEVSTVDLSKLTEILASLLYHVTASHHILGSVTAENLDPCLAPASVVTGNGKWFDEKVCGAPRMFYTQINVAGITNLQSPRLLETSGGTSTFNHIFLDVGAVSIWQNFQSELAAFDQRVKSRNINRANTGQKPYRGFDMDVMESSVAI